MGRAPRSAEILAGYGRSMLALKSKRSGYYLKQPGEWTLDDAKALSFENEWLARSFAQAERVEDVQFVEVHLPNPEFDLAA